MQRLLVLLLLIPLCVNLTACGNIFVRGALLAGSSVTGSVSVVQLSSVMDGPGSTVQVTFVTFLQEARVHPWPSAATKPACFP